MVPSFRKLVGAGALLGWVIFWVLLAMGFAQLVLPGATGWWAALYYLIAGLGWLPLAMLIVSWMSRGARPG